MIECSVLNGRSMVPIIGDLRAAEREATREACKRSLGEIYPPSLSPASRSVGRTIEPGGRVCWAPTVAGRLARLR